MSFSKTGARAGAVAVTLGLALVGPQTVGLAAATPSDNGQSAASDGSDAAQPSSSRSKMSSATPPTDGGSSAQRTPKETVPTSANTGEGSAVAPGIDDPASAPEDSTAAYESADAVAEESGAGSAADIDAAASVETSTSIMGGSFTSQVPGTGSKSSDFRRGGTRPSVSPFAADQRPTSIPSSAADRIGQAAVSAIDAVPGDAPTANPLATLPAFAIDHAAPPVAKAAVTPIASATGVDSRIYAAIAAFFGLSNTPTSLGDLVIGVMEVMRRQLQRTLFNTAPTAIPVRYAQLRSGQVIGNIGAADVDGDTLTYTVIQQPQYGTVDITSTGLYTYTPEPDFLSNGGADTFTVAVADQGWHLNLNDLFRPAATNVNVTVNVNASNGQLDGYTQGFTIYNFTSKPLTYLGSQPGKDASTSVIDSGPKIGTVIQPGEATHFELTYYPFSQNRVTANFTDGNEYYQALMFEDGLSGHSIHCISRSVCEGTKDTMYFMDSPGTVVNIPSDQKQQQANILNRLCDGMATCSLGLKGKAPEPTWTGWYPMPNFKTPDNAFGTTPINTAITVSYTQESSTSVQVVARVKAELFEMFGAEYENWQGQTYTQSQTQSQQLSFDTQPGYQTPVFSNDPVLRSTGDLTVVLGNTTWRLTDVYFDTPDTTRQGKWQPRPELSTGESA